MVADRRAGLDWILRNAQLLIVLNVRLAVEHIGIAGGIHDGKGRGISAPLGRPPWTLRGLARRRYCGIAERRDQ